MNDKELNTIFLEKYIFILYLKRKKYMADEQKEKKNKKVTKMTLSEVETALKRAKDNNDETSKYVQHLMERKEILTSE